MHLLSAFASADDYKLSRETVYSPAKTASSSSSAHLQVSEDRKKLSLIELMMFNMSSVLASVGAGCDVRLSNVISSQQLLSGSIAENISNSKSDKSKKRINNTYHGSTKHIRLTTITFILLLTVS